MTIDEAINHCLEQARTLQDKADTLTGEESRNCMECSADHIQLAEWLTELKEAKKLLKEALIIAKTRPFCDEHYCNICKNVGCELGEDCFEWEHEDEVLALISENKE